MYITQKILTEVFEILDEELEAREKELHKKLEVHLKHFEQNIERLLNQFKEEQIKEILPRIVEEQLDSVLDLKIKRLKPVLLENTLFTLIKQNGTD